MGIVKSVKGLHAYAIIVIASVAWGTFGVFAKLSYNYGIFAEALIASILLINFATLGFALAIFDRSALRIQKTDLPLFLILGIFAVALQITSYLYAVNFTTVTVATILFYTYPVFVALTAGFLFKEKITSSQWIAIFLTLFGVALVVKAYDSASLSVNLVGIFFGLLASLLFVLYFMLTRKLRHKYESRTLNLYSNGIGALAFLPILFLPATRIAEFPLQLELLIFAAAMISFLIPSLLYSYALKYVEASKGGILSVLEPLSAATLSAILLGERLESLQMVGIALALVGVVLIFQMKRKHN